MYSARNKKFLDLLDTLNIDVSSFSDLTFSGMFEGTSAHLIDWVVENVSCENVLSTQEAEELKVIESSDLFTEEKQLDEMLALHSPTLDDLVNLSESEVKYIMPRRLTAVENEIQGLNQIYSKLCKEEEDMKHSLKVLSSGRKASLKSQQEEKSKCLKITESIDDTISNLCKVPRGPIIQFHLEPFLRLLEEVQHVFKNLSLSERYCANVNVDMKWVDQLSTLTAQKAISHCKCVSFEDDGKKIKPSINATELDNDIKNLELEINILAKEMTCLHGSKVKCDIYETEIAHMVSRVKNLQILIDTMKTLITNNHVINIILDNCIENIEHTTSTFLQLHQSLEDDIKHQTHQKNLNYKLKKGYELVTKKLYHREPLLLELYQILNCEAEYDYKILMENSHSVQGDYSDMILHATEKSYQVYLKSQHDINKFVSILLNYLRCGPSREVQIFPVNFSRNCQLFSCASKEVRLKLTALTEHFLHVKDATTKSGKERDELLWTWFLINPNKFKAIIEKQENM